ncbi:MAG: N-6 DNA methylase [Synergistaceae bacterium]|jgi:type I restriction-modification system DNA methylase subunit|nr:N-6 DNA methylase [Synergistaceae bacterium]
MSLFQKSVEKKYLNELDSTLIDSKYTDFQNYFGNPERQENIRNSKEEQFQEGFLRELFVNILGYTLNPEPNFNLTTELKNIANSKKADGAILKGDDALAVIELKSTNTTDLDSIETQAFGYKNHHPKCVYVITSNFEKLRFYIQNAVDHVDFDLFKLTKEQFSLMWLCLSKDNLINDLPLKIKESSVLQEENITKKLYADYSKFREAIYNNLVKNNPDTDKLLLFKKTQKLLDRFLFIFFAEDRLLLPPNSISEIVKQWNTLKDLDAYVPLYDRFKLYFGYMNTGHKGKKYDIFAYNGGLFAPDEVLDNIIIDDSILHEHTLKLSSYNFNPDNLEIDNKENVVDVNILGHIFENSLGEIENVQAEIKGEEIDKQRTKRKKDGIFYTPKYITKYIVENTVGKLCEEKRNELDIIDEEYAKGRKNRKKVTIKTLDDKLTDYRNWLLSLTILDPACGSGAFLNQSLDFLITEHRKIDDLRAQLFGGAIVFSDITTDILEKNIYGVDLNEESVEIAKLSLWLRTAQKGRKLNKLNNNIKCGNSLIDNPEIAGEKAFSWKQEFPEIFAKGGFDVVIGNPPYGDYFNQIEKAYLLQTYSDSFSGTFDMYIVFYDVSLSLVRPHGHLCFITPYTFIDYSQFSALRKKLKHQNSIEQLISLVNVFEDAIVDTAITHIIREQKQNTVFAGIAFKNELDYIEKASIPLLDSANLKDEGFILKSQGNFNIDKLIENQPYKLGDLVKLTQGITTGGNECFINTKEYFIENKISENYIKKVLKGKTINRYKIILDDEYILYSTKNTESVEQEKIALLLEPFKEKLSKKRETKQGKLPWYSLHWSRAESDFNEPKILIRQTATHLIGVLDIENHYPIDSIHTLNLKNQINDKESVLSSLLGIINSSLFKYLYKWKLDEEGKVYPQVKKVNVEWLPIPDISDTESLASKTKEIQQLNKQQEHVRLKFLKYLLSKFGNSISISNLQYWDELEFSTFIDELNNSNANKITKSDEMDWLDIFEEKKEEIKSLKSKIERTDKEIDQIVYGLYGLSEAEIKIVEES